MGIFDSKNLRQTLRELSELFGADDRVTGMIPDTYDDPSKSSSYGRQFWSGVSGIDKFSKPFEGLGAGLLYHPQKDWIKQNNENTRKIVSRPYVKQDAEGTWQFDKLPNSLYLTENGLLRNGLDDPSAPNRITFEQAIGAASDALEDVSLYKGAEQVVDKLNKVSGYNLSEKEKEERAQAEAVAQDNRYNFMRGITLADDSELFVDRKTYLDDGTVGSEEKARGYKLEGTKELTRGFGYGVVNVPDSVLGLAFDDDSVMRAPTQALKRGLAYEETGDEAVDSALSAVHSLGEGIGETVATGGASSLATAGARTAAQFVPRQILSRLPDVVPYSWRERLRTIPHIGDALNTKGGAEFLGAVNEGVIDYASLYQIAQEEDWGEKDLSAAAGMLAATDLLGNYAVTRPRKKLPHAPKNPLTEKAKLKAKIKAKENETATKTIKIGNKEEEIEYDVFPASTNLHAPQMYTFEGEPLMDPVGKHPLYYLPLVEEEIEVNTKKGIEKRKKSKLERPHQISYQSNDKGKGKWRKQEKKEVPEIQRVDIPNIHNEEIDVYPRNSSLEAQGVQSRSTLQPSDGLIFQQELKRVFGKHTKLEQKDKNTVHVTLPNGVELDTQMVQTIWAPGDGAVAVRERYGLPKEANFRLKGSLTQTNAGALIRLSNLRNDDTLQHEAVHFAIETVTTQKEKKMLRELFGEREENQVAGIMEAIAVERAAQGKHPNRFINKVLRKIESLGQYVGSFVENVPTAIAKRDLSYLQGQSSKEILKNYAKSIVDGSVWGRELAPVAKDVIQKHQEDISRTLEKYHSMKYPERPSIPLLKRSPNIFSILPYDNNPLAIDRSIVDKVLIGKHRDSIVPEDLARLPQELEQPILIIKGTWRNKGKKGKKITQNSDDYENTYNFLLDMVDKNDANILVPIGLGYMSNDKKTPINKIKSVYGLSPEMGAGRKGPNIGEIISMVRNKELQYVDKDKLLALVKRYKPEKYYEILDYLDKELPPHVYTVESYRALRNQRGLKAELDVQGNYADPIK